MHLRLLADRHLKHPGRSPDPGRSVRPVGADRRPETDIHPGFHADLGSLGPSGSQAAGAAGGWVTSDALRVAPFEKPGVPRLGPADVVIDVRARAGSRPWTRWVVARTSGAHAPDGPSPDLLITDPVCSGAWNPAGPHARSSRARHPAPESPTGGPWLREGGSSATSCVTVTR